MQRWHVNPETGKRGICRAQTIKSCKYVKIYGIENVFHGGENEAKVESQKIFRNNNQILATHTTYKNTFINYIKDNGGFTFNVKTNEFVSTGIVFSPYPERCQVIKNEDITDEDFVNFYKNNLDIFIENENHFLGAWNNLDDGNIYLDVSISTENREVAFDECIRYEQKAYFDLDLGEEVIVNPNAESGQNLSEEEKIKLRKEWRNNNGQK